RMALGLLGQRPDRTLRPRGGCDVDAGVALGRPPTVGPHGCLRDHDWPSPAALLAHPGRRPGLAWMVVGDDGRLGASLCDLRMAPGPPGTVRRPAGAGVAVPPAVVRRGP